jgi:glutathione peroxidase
MTNVYDFTVQDIEGKPVSLSAFKGKVLLIVNVASKCGFTGQYEGLQKLYTTYSNRNFAVLGFPANDFLGQEPGTEAEIKSFCTLTYGVTFPMFAKILVKGKVLLIVNVASKCGFTGQYEGLQELYTTYSNRNFAVLGFPANDFLGQEPGTEAEIQSFCTLTYGVTFPMFAKILVKGKDMHPLYKFLTSKETNPEFGGAISWNFNKFLIGRDGATVGRFGSRTKPEDKELVEAVEKALGELSSSIP